MRFFSCRWSPAYSLSPLPALSPIAPRHLLTLPLFRHFDTICWFMTIFLFSPAFASPLPPEFFAFMVHAFSFSAAAMLIFFMLIIAAACHYFRCFAIAAFFATSSIFCPLSSLPAAKLFRQRFRAIFDCRAADCRYAAGFQPAVFASISPDAIFAAFR